MPDTVYATVSTPGPPGPAGPAGPAGYSPTWIVAAGAPSSLIGNTGDMYINSSSSDVYGPKTSTGWGAVVCNIKGATGATGAAGYSPQYIVAAGPPTAGQGNVGDMFINSSTSDVYGPKTGAGWGPIVCNIKGSTGAQGPPGVAYTPKGAWASATTYAQGDEATYNSVLYISLQSSNTANQPDTSPTWWQPVATGGAAQTPWTSDIDAAGFKLITLAASNKDLVFAPNATERMRIAANGNVGIGTSSPTATLDITGAEVHLTASSGTSYARYEVMNAANVLQLAVEANAGGVITAGSTGNAAIISSQNAYPLHLCTTNQIRMTILATGNVGIGTTAPGATLDVSKTSIGFETIPLVVRNESTVQGTAAGMGFSPFTGGTLTGKISCVNLNASGNSFALAFSAWSGTSVTEGMRIVGAAGACQVGIGTSSPGSSAGEVLTIQTVGSGTKTYALALVNNAGATGTEVAIAFTPNTNIPLAEISAYRNSGGPTDLVFRTWNGSMAERMRITATGFVGINKSSASFSLDIAGDCNITGTYRVNGVPLSSYSGISNQTAPARSFNTVYQNTTGKPMAVAVSIQASSSNGGGQAYTDSASSPATIVGQAVTGANLIAQLNFWVLPGNYYKVVSSGVPGLLYWYEWY